MTLSTRITSEKMKSIKTICDRAPYGAKKTAAMKHFRAAEAAQTAKNDIKTNIELNAAHRALG